MRADGYAPPPPPRRRPRLWTWLAAVPVLAGCGNLTAGGATAEVVVSVAGDAPDSSPPPLTAPVALASDSDDDEPEGELELEFRLVLLTEGGDSVPLTDGEARVRVEFPGEQDTRVVTRTVPAERYVAVRVIFTEIEAEVDAGLVIGGVPVTGPIEVELEGEPLVVERALDLDLGEGEAAELLVDMNASGWLTAVDPDLRVVAAAAVEQLVRIARR